MEYLHCTYPGTYSIKLLRTLQRRVKHWKAALGPNKPVMFQQNVPVGWMGLSDFTIPDTPITIRGEPFIHRLYQFRLAYSGWRYVQIILGGESYSALADGLQNALERAGGCPQEHRTDSLSAAFTNRSAETSKDLTALYGELCTHYAMTPSRNNLGVSHENGAIETAHGSFKHRLDQQIKLRGSADFISVADYQAFIDQIVHRFNQRIREKFEEERALLKALPPHRFTDYLEVYVRVTRNSTIVVKRVLYSVPSRLIGEKILIHLHHDRLEGFIANSKVLSLPRIYPTANESRARHIDYRHVIHSLAAKPQAFRFALIRDDLLPNAAYRQFWNYADTHLEKREACKWMVGVLRLAADYNAQAQLEIEIAKAINERQELPTLDQLQSLFRRTQSAPVIPLCQHSLKDYDDLLQGAAHA
jgi:hypothetical protein